MKKIKGKARSFSYKRKKVEIQNDMLWRGYRSPIVLQDYNLAYYPVPKCACTTVKEALYLKKYGENHRSLAKSIHRMLPSTTLPEGRLPSTGMTTVAVVREPLERLASAYRHIIVRSRSLERFYDRGDLRGLDPAPDMSGFVSNIEAYCEISHQIRHHVRSFTDFLGHDLSFFDYLIPMEQLSNTAFPNVDLELEYSNSSPTSDVSLTDEAMAKAMSFLAPDYEAMGGIYSKPSDSSWPGYVKSSQLWRYDVAETESKIVDMTKLPSSRLFMKQASGFLRHQLIRGVLD
ncbi:sulfotransferase family 2 domain-containing protein [Salinisphaera sp. Q1T1-3]|uniref:sulfotransferase family 2 domain-containing protein n=1 Tax=Salinisphaera sp. Q1T1-3 TaxID=2321229 RepID=UPI000E7173C8|nr:sulfotransferase family 2 domain-containing protein [Salinisphaera sp. Q1T1-3]RJS91787.1 hypothetical protein D3260_14430 [Salinisphaera sp. Q1T1-3]